jgi:hypothetical protein
MRRRFGNTTTNSLFNASSFVLLDMDLRVIGHTETLMSPVGHFIDIWGDFFTVLQDGKVSSVCRYEIPFINFVRFTGIMRKVCSND